MKNIILNSTIYFKAFVETYTEDFLIAMPSPHSDIWLFADDEIVFNYQEEKFEINPDKFQFETIEENDTPDIIAWVEKRNARLNDSLIRNTNLVNYLNDNLETMYLYDLCIDGRDMKIHLNGDHSKNIYNILYN